MNAIIRHVTEEHEKGNKVGIFTIGPMTNLAMAIKMEPKIIPKISSVYIMGGTAFGFGNTTLASEFNFHFDPHAAQVCVKAFEKVHILPWETAYDFHITEEGNSELNFR